MSVQCVLMLSNGELLSQTGGDDWLQRHTIILRTSITYLQWQLTVLIKINAWHTSVQDYLNIVFLFSATFFCLQFQSYLLELHIQWIHHVHILTTERSWFGTTQLSMSKTPNMLMYRHFLFRYPLSVSPQEEYTLELSCSLRVSLIACSILVRQTGLTFSAMLFFLLLTKVGTGTLHILFMERLICGLCIQFFHETFVCKGMTLICTLGYRLSYIHSSTLINIIKKGYSPKARVCAALGWNPL